MAVCSPARRTRETALRLGLDPVEQSAFREQDFGVWTGRRHNDLITELGAAYHEFWKSPASNRPPGGESFVDQIDRARAGLALLPAGDAVLVVHSGTIRAVLAIALDLAPDSALRFVIDPLSLTRIDRLADGWRVGRGQPAFERPVTQIQRGARIPQRTNAISADVRRQLCRVRDRGPLRPSCS